MSYQVKTAVFEGPLDLLLQLITSREVEVTEVSLSELVSEYLGYLEAIREMDLEVTSEFLLIAATLIQIKARRLLPGDQPVDLDEELALAEERDRLLSRLLACLTFKDVAAVLRYRMDASARHVAREVGLEGLTPPPPELRLTAGPADLARLAVRALARAAAEPELDHLDLDLPSVSEAMADLRVRVAELLETDFESLVLHCERTVEVVAYFLALLELARWGVVGVDQEHPDAPIAVRAAGGTVEFESEWTR